MEAMAGAVDNAEVMVVGVSRQYKESSNCRLEASYGHAQNVDLIPLMMEENYKPNVRAHRLLIINCC